MKLTVKVPNFDDCHTDDGTQFTRYNISVVDAVTGIEWSLAKRYK
jgi:hypothetical protein